MANGDKMVLFQFVAFLELSHIAQMLRPDKIEFFSQAPKFVLILTIARCLMHLNLKYTQALQMKQPHVIVQPHRRVINSGNVTDARVTLMDGEHVLEQPVRSEAIT